MPFVNKARSLRPGLLLLLLVFAAGCATPQTDRLLASPPGVAAKAELAQTPFFPQEEYQCGPASLAALLVNAGTDASPEQLAREVYIPGLKGSLQVEMAAAPRRHGRVPYLLRPDLAAIIEEIDAGNPVLVLQNLGLDSLPVWHYSVLVGYDLGRATVVQRTGLDFRREAAMRTFERTWGRAGHWALVVMPPDRLPRTAEEGPYLESVRALERLDQWPAAATAYAAALKRWPESLVAHMGLGNSRYAQHDLAGAEEAFRAALRFHPQAAPAHNNLAQTLADEGRWSEAEAAARRAVALEGPYADEFRRTLENILTRRPAH